MSVKASCHCGQVKFTLSRPPVDLGSCNCSICRRLGALWGYYTESEVEQHFDESATSTYIQGDKCLAMHTCRTWGCTTHWSGVRGSGVRGSGVGDTSDDPRMAVNCRLMDPDDLKDIPIRKIDGTSW